MAYKTRGANFSHIPLGDEKTICLPDIGKQRSLPWDDLPKVQHGPTSIRKANIIQTLIKEGLVNNPLDVIKRGELWKSDDTLDLQIERFCLRLHLYYKTEPAKGFVFTYEDYLINNLRHGPVFAKYLSKLRAALFIKTLSNYPLVSNNSFLEKYISGDGIFPRINVESVSYDSILNERFLIDYEETSDDFEWSFKPVEKNPSVIEKFRLMARQMLYKYKTEIDVDFDFSTWISDSITFTDSGPKINRVLLRETPEDELRELMLPRNRITPLRFERSVVSIEPGNCRDTWQCYPETLFVIKRVSHLLRQVLEPIPFSAMCSSEKAYRRRKLLRKKGNFLMFDYKKCGLTVNRELLVILGEELEAIYPGKGFIEMCSFSDVTVTQGKGKFKPCRGTGLGNCNEGITLLQCVVGFWIKETIGTDSIFFNDDGVFYSSELPRKSFVNILTLLNGLGMIVNLEKTIISKYNVFCEDYITDEEIDFSKQQLRIVGFADCFFKSNVVSAKSLYFSLHRDAVLHGYKVDNHGLIQRYGFEFHKFEEFLPYEFGGWNYIGRTSLNESLRFIFEPNEYLGPEGLSMVPFMRRWIRFLTIYHNSKKDLLSRKKIYFKKFIENPFKDPLLNIPQSENTEEILSILALRNSRQDIQTLDDLYNVRGSHNAKPKLKSRLLNKLLHVRRGIWKEFKKRTVSGISLTIGSLFRLLEYLRGVEQMPINYLPPEILISRWEYFPKSEMTPKGYAIFPRFRKLGNRNNIDGCNQLCESVLKEKLLPRSMIFSLRDKIAENKSTSILSGKKLYIKKDVIFPNYMYLFCSSKNAIGAVYNLVYDYKKYPTGFEDLGGEYAWVDYALSPLKILKPSLETKFWNTYRENKQYGKLLERWIASLDNPDQELEDALDIFAETVNQGKSRIEFKVELEDFEVNEELAREIIGEYENLDEMLEDFDEEELPPPEYEEEEYISENENFIDDTDVYVLDEDYDYEDD